MKPTELASVCNINMGQAPAGSSYNSNGVGLPLLAGAGDFGIDFPAATKFTSIPTKVSEPNDIIICIRATIGDLNWSDRAYCLGRGVAGLRPNPKLLDRNYLWHWLVHAKAKLENKARGSTFKQVSRRDVAELEILLPSTLDEQRRIAAILDRANAIRRKREQALTLADDFLRSVFLAMFGDPVENLSGWPLEALGSVCSKITDGTHDTPPRQSSGVMFITGKNIRPFRVDRQNVEFVSEEVHQEIYRRCNPEYGDVLYTNIGAGTGNAAFNDANVEFSMKNVALLKPDAKLTNGRFLESLLNHDGFRRQLLGQFGQGGAQGFLGLKTIKSIKVPVPPVELQTQFFRLAEKIKSASARIEVARLTDEDLFSSLAQRAFRGEL